MNTAPYQIGDKWYIDRDPDDKERIWANISTRLLDLGTTAASVTAIAIGGVQILTPARVDDPSSLVSCKITGHDDTAADNGITFRVICSDSDATQFDKTIHFKRLDG